MQYQKGAHRPRDAGRGLAKEARFRSALGGAPLLPLAVAHTTEYDKRKQDLEEVLKFDRELRIACDIFSTNSSYDRR